MTDGDDEEDEEDGKAKEDEGRAGADSAMVGAGSAAEVDAPHSTSASQSPHSAVAAASLPEVSEHEHGHHEHVKRGKANTPKKFSKLEEEAV